MRFEKRPAVFEVNEIGGGKRAFVIHHHPGLASLHAKRGGFGFGLIGAGLGFLAGMFFAAGTNKAEAVVNVLVMSTILGALTAGVFGYLLAIFVVKTTVRGHNKIVFSDEGFSVRGRAMRWHDVSNFYAQSPDQQLIVGKNAYAVKAKVDDYNRMAHFEWKVCVDFGQNTVVVFKRVTEIQAHEIAQALNDLRAQNIQSAA